jgi:Immunity protein Imm1
MSAKFFDLHNDSNPDNGAEIVDGLGAKTLLARNAKNPPFAAELISDSHTKLMLGLGPKIGFVQFSTADDEPPYLVAKLDSENMQTGITEFTIGNEPSEIELRLCIPLAVLLEVVAYFVETGQRSSIVAWEEI